MAVPRISKEELRRRLDGVPAQAPLVIDVRLTYPFEHSTIIIPGALRLPPDAVATADLPRDRDIVFYDSDPEELVSATAAAQLARRGYRALALQGGIAEWVNARLPTEARPAPKSSTSPGDTPLKT